MRKKSYVEQLVRRLEICRNELEFRVLVSLKERFELQTVKQDARFNQLDSATREILTSIIDGREAFATSLEDQTRALKANQEESENRIIEALNFTMIERTTAQTARDRVLLWLRFRHIKARHDDVAKAHLATCEWVFQEGQLRGAGPGRSNLHRWDSLVDWLEGASGCYWIEGKAGSGKSTLMKFLVNDQRTREHLSVWAGNDELCIASFFFWAAGTTLQKTQLGLMRAILYEVLRRHPELIEVVLPEVFAELSLVPRGDDDEPTSAELTQALHALTSQRSVSLKLCLIIDGIDEYDGDISELAGLLRSLNRSSTVKVLLSSRPTQPCVMAFHGYPKLRLQDLTFRDIQRYARDKAAAHELMADLALQHPNETTSLIDDVVLKADGVFLWVMLVMKALLNELENGGFLEDLQVRLKELPRDLSNLYDAMLSKMEPVYRRQAAQLLQIFRTSSQLSLGTMVFAHADGLREGFMKSATRDGEFPSLLSTQAETVYQRFERRLRTRCCGLLEVSHALDSEVLADSLEDASDDDKPEDRWARSEVRYLHRSVVEFLEADGQWEKITRWNKSKEFEPHTRLARAYLYLAQCSLPETTTPSALSKQECNAIARLCRSCLIQLLEADKCDSRPNTEIVEGLFGLIARCYTLTNWQPEVFSKHWATQPQWLEFLVDDKLRPIQFAACLGLKNYFMDRVFEIVRAPFVEEGWSEKARLALIILKRFGDATVEDQGPVESYEAMLTYLLCHRPGGISPNASYGGTIVWSEAITRTLKASKEDLPALGRILLLMIDLGARRTKRIAEYGKPLSVVHMAFLARSHRGVEDEVLPEESGYCFVKLTQTTSQGQHDENTATDGALDDEIRAIGRRLRDALEGRFSIAKLLRSTSNLEVE